MKQSDFDVEIAEFSANLQSRLHSDGSKIAYGLYQASLPIIEWLGYLTVSEATGTCDNFLDGLRASVVEVAGCGAAGLVRPAIFAMRAQIDVILAWLYFKDHPVEWCKVEDTGDGFVLRREALDYLKEYVPKFQIRSSMLLANSRRKERMYIGCFRLMFMLKGLQYSLNMES